MLTLPPSVKIYLASGHVDMRKSIDGLLAVVRSIWEEDPFSGHLFVFFSRKVNRIKILMWDNGGFMLIYKRLERGRFRIPEVAAGSQSVKLDATELVMLLQGIDVSRVRRPVPWMPGNAGQVKKTT
jgi:transposase